MLSLEITGEGLQSISCFPVLDGCSGEGGTLSSYRGLGHVVGGSGRDRLRFASP